MHTLLEHNAILPVVCFIPDSPALSWMYRFNVDIEWDKQCFFV